MRWIASLSLIVTLLGCGHEVPVESASKLKSQLRREFTGKAAEDLIGAFEAMGLRVQENNSQPVYGFAIDDIVCTMVPSPRATALCQLRQAETNYDGGSKSDLIYQTFLKHGASLQLEGGITHVRLRDVICERYNVYRGVSKCFFR